MNQQKWICLFPIFSDRPDLEKDSVRPSNIDSGHPRMEDSMLVSSNAEMSIGDHLLLPSVPNILIGPYALNH